MVQQAVQLARKLNFVKGEARALNRMGAVLRLRGQFPEALKTLFDALEIVHEEEELPPILFNCPGFSLNKIELSG